jgi:hypothetical protein
MKRSTWFNGLTVLGLSILFPAMAADWQGQRDSGKVSHPKKICNQLAGNCLGLSAICQNKGSSSWPDSYFTCNNTIWLSAKVTLTRNFGECIDSGEGCDSWGSYYCIKIDCYSSPSCVSPQCSVYLSSSDRCEPGAGAPPS